MTPEQRARLPKARLFSIYWDKHFRQWPWFYHFRFANARLVFLGPLRFTLRAPWLEGPARQLHPEVFAQHHGDAKP